MMTGDASPMDPSAYHAVDEAQLLAQLACDPRTGLSSEAAAHRLEATGPNQLPDLEGRPALSIALEQLRSAMVLMLMVAAGVSMYLGGITDAIAIGAIVCLNAVLGFVQDYRAEQAMAALRKLSTPQVQVRRDGVETRVSATVVVPGDIMLLHAGDQVAADGRLLRVEGLSISEAALTGESTPVDKHVHTLAERALALGDRNNMAFRGTAVTRGRGEMVVTATGVKTELGRIASMLQAVERKPTPMQRRLAQFGRVLAGFALLLVGVVVALGLLRGDELQALLMTGLSLAVAAVPEGLPAVATVALALGARRMLGHKALVRKLPAVESMGAITVVCTDKTGTLTQNRMVVTAYTLASGGQGDGTELSRPEALPLLACAVLCNDAQAGAETGPSGDPTEVAFLDAATQAGLSWDGLRHAHPRRGGVPFDSTRMRMTTVHAPVPDALCLGAEVAGRSFKAVACLKGSVASMLDVSGYWPGPQGPEPLTAARRASIEGQEAALAERGLRVLGLAVRLLDEVPAAESIDASIEADALFLGMLALEDPLRPEAAPAMAKCLSAGIRPIMITGDHPRTARAIGRALGIGDGRAPARTGRELAEVDAQQLAVLVGETSIYARVSPEHKLRIVAALQANGEIVAMTGDGVNDAPALKQADIGVAMGQMGTDVAREAADAVLLDDNFATIVHAVEEGRTILQNVRKFLRYTMTSNAGEIVTMLLGPLTAVSLPLLPLQILWVNLVTDGIPGLALAMEPTEPGTMQAPPRSPDAPLFDRALAFDVCWIGLLMGGVSLAVAHTLAGADEARFRTLAFTVLTLSQLGNAFGVRSDRRPIWEVGLSSNPAMTWAVGLSVLTQIAVLYVPFTQRIFHTVALSPFELAVALLSSTLVWLAVDLRKLWGRRGAGV